MAVGVVRQPVKKETVTQRVRQQLEREILFGIYGPGEHLDEVALAAHLGWSRTPVREVLNQLVALGWLIRHAWLRRSTLASLPRRRGCIMTSPSAWTPLWM